ncbi:transmembrane protein 72 [Halichoeres trimaculatus]|uniref:transmembrane protein 72 n=1 Tax=Halichoeres trimaculatus TaxID=147232 RepID=UPI003D9F98B0
MELVTVHSLWTRRKLSRTSYINASLIQISAHGGIHFLKLWQRKALEAMGNSESVWWVVVEFACRILGVSTATVLCAVGVETLQQGEFSSLGIYLLVSSVGIMLFELAYFLDVLLFMCLPCPPDWMIFVLWGKMAHVGGFHKFLYYSIMAVVCFLHPVLVWHAIIPGIMLLVTALFNFVLSKKTKKKCPKRPQENHNDPGPTTVCVSQGAPSHISSFSFLHVLTGRRGGGGGVTPPTRDPSFSPGEGGESVQAMLELQQTTAPRDSDRERRRWTGRMCFRGREEPVEREMEEMEGYGEAETDTTSDTAPMITD